MAETLEYRGYGGKKRDVYFEAPGFFVAPSEIESAEHGGVALISGHRVVKLDLATQTAYLDDGRSLKYQKCLIATGKSKSLYLHIINPFFGPQLVSFCLTAFY